MFHSEELLAFLQLPSNLQLRNIAQSRALCVASINTGIQRCFERLELELAVFFTRASREFAITNAIQLKYFVGDKKNSPWAVVSVPAAASNAIESRLSAFINIFTTLRNQQTFCTSRSARLLFHLAQLLPLLTYYFNCSTLIDRFHDQYDHLHFHLIKHHIKIIITNLLHYFFFFSNGIRTSTLTFYTFFFF